MYFLRNKRDKRDDIALINGFTRRATKGATCSSSYSRYLIQGRRGRLRAGRSENCGTVDGHRARRPPSRRPASLIIARARAPWRGHSPCSRSGRAEMRRTGQHRHGSIVPFPPSTRTSFRRESRGTHSGRINYKLIKHARPRT